MRVFVEHLYTMRVSSNIFLPIKSMYDQSKYPYRREVKGPISKMDLLAVIVTSLRHVVDRDLLVLIFLQYFLKDTFKSTIYKYVSFNHSI